MVAGIPRERAGGWTLKIRHRLCVNSDKDRVLAKEKMEKDGANLRSWWDGGGKEGPISNRWNVECWPTVYVIDGKGSFG